MISVTTLTTQLYCARKLWLQQVLKLKEPVKDVMVLGTVTHQAFNGLNKREQEIVTATPRDATQASIDERYTKTCAELLRWSVASNKYSLRNVQIPLEKAFSLTWPMLKREAAIRSLNLFENLQRHGVVGEALWDALSPKIKSEYSIKVESLELKGIIDQLQVYPNFVRPIELKTGKVPAEGVWPGHRIQVGAYALMLEHALQIKVEEAIVHYLDTHTQRTVVMNPFLREEILALRDATKETLAQTTPPPKTPDVSKCASCGLRGSCYDDALIQVKTQSLNTNRSIAIPQ